jgi:dethiobiotin synthetase/adenosylmethionine--8-amino-7-oxononanoate aminotransferase
MTATIATAKTAAKVTTAAAFFAKATKAFQVHGANTEVGKTIFSTALLTRNNGDGMPTHYIKPVSTGPAAEEDLRHIKRYSPKTAARCLVQYTDPVSPHLAVMRDAQTPLADSEVVAEVRRTLAAITGQPGAQDSFALVESAGGVLSPGPSGSLQADIYRPLRLPALLVGDSKLGGISATISAYESLFLRGFDVPLLLTFKEDQYRNFEFFRDFFAKKNVEVAAIPAPPPPLPSLKQDALQMQDYYSEVSHSEVIKQANDYLTDHHKKRLSDLQSIKERASETIWYPFSQHSLINKSTITAIDSAHGDFFQSFQDNSSSLEPLFDASASWWTQGLGHGNPDLALTAANAAGRYGHVILANTIHEPALKLAEKLLALTANPRLSRVFYSDNGSTGVEVAIKMAFKAACARYSWAEPSSNGKGSALRNIGVLGLKRSYHGDTIGTMDCCEPSVYNKQVNWYRERGAWLEYPIVKQFKGHWVVENLETGDIVEKFNSLKDVFSLDKRDRKTFESYKTTVIEAIKKHLNAGKKFGALLIEPVLLGAGGMMAV